MDCLLSKMSGSNKLMDGLDDLVDLPVAEIFAAVGFSAPRPLVTSQRPERSNIRVVT
jgi:hypothetical protein